MLRILLLCDDQRGAAGTIHDHIQMFPRYSRHRIELFNPRGLRRSRYLRLDGYDVVVVHYSLVVIWDDYLSPWFRERIAEYDGLKVQFLQDEYRWVDEITAAIRAMGIDALYSCVPADSVDAVYGARLPQTEVLPTLTGYVPERLVGRTVPSLAARPLDVGYRGRSTPMWLGRLGREKIEIGQRFLEHAERLGLRCDIAWSERDRIYGARWHAFIASCRAMLASESGSSIVDFDRSVERAVRAYLAQHPAAGYDEIERDVLAAMAGGPTIRAVSPRVFETAAARTALVMFPGEYSGVVMPERHYIVLEKDFSNVDEVAERLRDTRFLEELTERAYADVIESRAYSERAFVQRFDEDMDVRAVPRAAGTRTPRRRLALEQARTGRTYRLSTLYGLVRRVLLRYVGLKQALRRPALRRLALRRPRGPLWEDVFRLAVLASVQRGQLYTPKEPFRVVPKFDPLAARLTFTSRRQEEDGAARDDVRPEVARAIRQARLREIVWNHATLDQWISIPVTPARLQVSFDVGSYDAYGVYRFSELAELSRTEPELVLAALDTVLAAPSPSRDATRPPTPTKDELT